MGQSFDGGRFPIGSVALARRGRALGRVRVRPVRAPAVVRERVAMPAARERVSVREEVVPPAAARGEVLRRLDEEVRRAILDELAAARDAPERLAHLQATVDEPHFETWEKPVQLLLVRERR